jgi:hypothetical protein
MKKIACAKEQEQKKVPLNKGTFLTKLTNQTMSDFAQLNKLLHRLCKPGN